MEHAVALPHQGKCDGKNQDECREPDHRQAGPLKKCRWTIIVWFHEKCAFSDIPEGPSLEGGMNGGGFVIYADTWFVSKSKLPRSTEKDCIDYGRLMVGCLFEATDAQRRIGRAPIPV